MIRLIIILLLLSGCDSGGGSSSGSNSNNSNSGFISSVTNGFGAGMGAAAGHQAIQHGIDKFKKYKENKASRSFKPREKVINPRSRFTGRRR